MFFIKTIVAFAPFFTAGSIYKLLKLKKSNNTFIYYKSIVKENDLHEYMRIEKFLHLVWAFCFLSLSIYTIFFIDETMITIINKIVVFIHISIAIFIYVWKTVKQRSMYI